MDLLNQKYIILEIIPSGISPDKGDVIQLSALKLNGLNILERFDYRLNEDKIKIPDFLDIINYDKDAFTYKDTSDDIMKEFDDWSEDIPLLIIDNIYTKNFLESIKNEKESIFKYLNTEYKDNIIEEIVQQYGLEPSNYIVDLLFEALIKNL